MLRRCCLLFCCLLLSLPVRAEESVALPLTAELRTWLAEHRELRVGVVTEAPYAQYDRRLQQYSGANVELMGWLATAMQVTLRWQGYPDQAALDDALRAGRVDIAPGLSQTPAGLRLWLFPGWWWGSAMAAAASNWSNWSAIPGLPCGPAVR